MNAEYWQDPPELAELITKERHRLLSAYLVIASAFSALLLLGVVGGIAGENTPFYLFVVVTSLASLRALWRWRKWGFYIWVATSFVQMLWVGGITTSFISPSFYSSVILYVLLQIGGEKKGWTQLE